MKVQETIGAYPCWEVSVSTNEPIDGKYVLTQSDLDRLSIGTKFAIKLKVALPAEVEAIVTLSLPKLQIYLVPSETAPKTFGLQDCLSLADEIVTGMFTVASECRKNAAAAKPLPLTKVVTVPCLLPVLKALVGNGKKDELEISFTGTQGIRRLPKVSPVDFTAGAEASADKVVVKRRAVVGLFYDRRKCIVAVFIADVAERVLLPDGWTWEQVKKFLDEETSASGTMRREGDEWRLLDGVIFEPKLV